MTVASVTALVLAITALWYHPPRAVVTAGRPIDVMGDIRVNGVVRQEAGLAEMIWSPAEIVAQASRLWRLAPGDLIFTGTPEGVGPLVRGDAVQGEVEGVGSLAFGIV